MQFDTIVVGARVAGCATAFALAQRGWRVALVERKHRPLGGTLSLPITQPRALARFRDLGLLPMIEKIMPHFKSEVGDGLQTISAWFPVQQFPLFRQKPATRLQETWQSSPELAERMAHIQLVGKTMGLSPQSADGYFRPTGGPGWVLVGDARHYKDPASGQGLHDALYSVQQLLGAIESVTGGNPLTLHAAQSAWPRAMTIMQRRSDRELMPMYTFTYTFAEGLTRPPTYLEHALLRAIAENPAITQRFLGIMTGATSVTAFNRLAPLYMLRGLLPFNNAFKI